jgi:hypothetical protein
VSETWRRSACFVLMSRLPFLSARRRSPPPRLLCAPCGMLCRPR